MLGNLKRGVTGVCSRICGGDVLPDDRSAVGDYVVGTGETHSIRKFLEGFSALCRDELAGLCSTDPLPAADRGELSVIRSGNCKIDACWEPVIKFKQLVRIWWMPIWRARGRIPGEGRALIEKHFGTAHLGESAALDGMTRLSL